LFQKLGLSVESLSRGPHAEMLSPFENFTPEETAIYQRHLDRFYTTFLSRVARSRGMAIEAVDSIAQGRVWTGLSARPRGLVDRFGGIEEAIAEARARALIGRSAEVIIDTYPRSEGSFLARAVAGMFDGSNDESRVELPPVVQAWLAAARFPAGSGLALMPCLIQIR
jgi:protease IV